MFSFPRAVMVVFSSILIPDPSSTWAFLFTCTTEHFFWFQWRPISYIAPLVSVSTRFSFLSGEAKTFTSSIYRRSVTLTSIGLDNRYPSVARRRHALGFRHSVNNLGHKASPWGSPFMNLIFLEVSRPWLVVATTLVFQLAHNLPPSQMGSLCTSVIAHSMVDVNPCHA